MIGGIPITTSYLMSRWRRCLRRDLAFGRPIGYHYRLMAEYDRKLAIQRKEKRAALWRKIKTFFKLAGGEAEGK